MKTNRTRLLAENTHLSTQRLFLRPKTMDDAKDMFEFTSNAEVARFVFPPDKTIEELKDYMAQSMSAPLGKFVIELKDDHKVIGTIDFLKLKENSAEIGYVIHQDYWGKGYATEALRALIDFSFEKLKLKTVTCEHDHENPASGRVMQKAGMNKIETLRKMDKQTKTVRSFVQYEIRR